MRDRARVRRKMLLVVLGLAWLGVTTVGLVHRDVAWVSVIFFVSGVYGTILMVAGILPRRPDTVPGTGYAPFVSVIVPARNEQGVIADTVRCLCGLDYADPDGCPRFEVIVVDHRSTDRTPQVLDALRRTLAFTVVRPTPEDGVGKAVALNVGLAAARGEAICVFDADARVAPDFLARLVPYLGRPGVAGVQARKLVYEGGRNALMRAQEDDYIVFQTLTQRSRHRIGGAVILTGNGLITRRDALEAVGGWNEDALTEDIDLTIRYALRGWTVHYCEHVVVWEEAVPTWRALIQQRTRWSEGSLRCLFDHAAALVRAPVPWRKRLDFLVFLSSSLVMALSMIASYGYLVEQWVSDATSRGLSVADALPVRGHQPMYTYYWIVVMLATIVAIAIERKPGALMLAWSSGRYIAFAMHQIVTLPLALYRYSRSVFTGRFEWMKTEHHGVGLPDLSGLLAGRPATASDVAESVLARVGFAGGADPTVEAVPPPP
ncbi:MAG TPA: glycosyltransferase family 2 protein [bacterium]|nr:glycosyltransferase family 2 protein [bacterium]